jgi:hypothetical protein
MSAEPIISGCEHWRQRLHAFFTQPAPVYRGA